MSMFWKKKSRAVPPPAEAGSLIDPSDRLPIARKETPGYYPGFHTLDQQKFWDEATRKVVLDRVADIPPIRFFSAAEAATMTAVIARILPQDDRAESTRIPILPAIDERLYLNRIEGYRYEDMPPDQEAYRLAIRAIEAMAQQLYRKSFSALKTMYQEALLQSLHDNKPLVAKELWQGLDLKRFWAMLVSDCCAVYYAHPFAWDEIGFGGPAYPRGYMRLEGGETESWEVDEQRYDWLAPDDTLSDRPQQTGGQESSHQGQAGTH